MVVEICKSCTGSVPWPESVRSLLGGLRAEITDEEQAGNLVHCFCLACDSFLTPAVLLYMFRGFSALVMELGKRVCNQ